MLCAAWQSQMNVPHSLQVSRYFFLSFRPMHSQSAYELSSAPARAVRSTTFRPYFSWKIEIGRDWYRSQIGRDLGAKVKMCTPVHGLSGFSAIDQT